MKKEWESKIKRLTIKMPHLSVKKNIGFKHYVEDFIRERAKNKNKKWKLSSHAGKKEQKN